MMYYFHYRRQEVSLASPTNIQGEGGGNLTRSSDWSSFNRANFSVAPLVKRNEANKNTAAFI